MQIFINTLSGKQFALEVEQTTTVDEVKSKIADREGLPTGRQILSLPGKKTVLEDGKTLSAYGIGLNAKINLAFKLGEDS
jgi:hypothetical protein